MGKFIGGIIIIWFVAILIYVLWNIDTLFLNGVAIWIIISAVICVYNAIKDRF